MRSSRSDIVPSHVLCYITKDIVTNVRVTRRINSLFKRVKEEENGPKVILVFDTDPRHECISKDDFRMKLIGLMKMYSSQVAQLDKEEEVEQGEEVLTAASLAASSYHDRLSRKALAALLDAVDGWIPWRAQRKAFRDVSLRLILTEMIAGIDPVLVEHNI